jgi:phosphatidylglycerophosphatase A
LAEQSPNPRNMRTKKQTNRTLSETAILFAAQGFGSGLFPVAPGTFGTLAGFAWIYLLLLPQSLWIYIAGIVIGFFVAVWLGRRAEQILGVEDPGSVVIDEITALPLAFLGPVILFSHNGATPPFSHYLTPKHLITCALTFALFRLFDITKPWLIHRSQNIPGGWGLVLDDFLAALPVIPVAWACAALMS